MADALSCLDNSDNAQVNILQSEIIQFDPSLILKDILSQQQTDSFCSHIFSYLPQNILFFLLTVKMRAKPLLGQGL